MIEGGADVAVRIDVPRDSNLIARKLAASHSVVCASPAYFARHGVPRCPLELAEHNCLTYKAGHGATVWTFKDSYGPQQVKVTGNLWANSAGALEAAACRGLGVAVAQLERGIIAQKRRAQDRAARLCIFSGA